jgi:hypothetical protein
LIKLHVSDVVGVRPHDTGYSAERKKYDNYDGEGVDGSFLSVFIGVDLLDVLAVFMLVALKATTLIESMSHPSLEIGSSDVNFPEVS